MYKKIKQDAAQIKREIESARDGMRLLRKCYAWMKTYVSPNTPLRKELDDFFDKVDLRK